MEVLDNKCPSCGAKIAFNPVNQKWDCEYCGSKFTLEEMQKHNNASTHKVNESFKILNNNIVNDMNADVYRCKNCGAEIMADENTVATFCVYCGSTAILKDKVNEGRSPNYIVPFSKVKDDAVSEFRKLVKKKPLAPRTFKSTNNIEKIKGIYIPFWAYDISVDGTVNFNATDTTSWSDSKYVYTKVDNYISKQDGHFDYNKVPADASSRFPNDLMDSIEPFDFNKLVEYNHAYLSGFFAEKYDISEDDDLDRVVSRAKNTAISFLRRNVHHDSSIVVEESLSPVFKDIHYIMLPVWMVSIKYKNKDYIFAMNGQTGKIVGDIPIGFIELLRVIVLTFIIAFIVSFGLLWFMM